MCVSQSPTMRHNSLARPLIGAVILGCAAVTGCVGPDRLKVWASPHVSCSADAMDISSIQSDRYTVRYDVACDTGKVYECTSRSGSNLSGPGTQCEFIGSVELAPTDEEPSTTPLTPTLDLSNHVWSRVRLDKCGASALMPRAAAVRDVVAHGTPGQSVVAETDGHEFVFACFDFSNVGANVPAERLAAGMLDGMLESGETELVRVQPSGTSIDFVIKVPTGHHRGRVQVGNNWGYAAVVGPMQGLASKDISKFVAGVEIGVPPSAQPGGRSR